ncbi:hypothetical protein, partial [Butyrivibrio sp. AE3009]|uniref:hypothetical protein n=1 Tax=Butyrivibrio sp. AE3009 TaxID=1280666 RepID=UPI001A996711
LLDFAHEHSALRAPCSYNRQMNLYASIHSLAGLVQQKAAAPKYDSLFKLLNIPKMTKEPSRCHLFNTIDIPQTLQ